MRISDLYDNREELYAVVQEYSNSLWFKNNIFLFRGLSGIYHHKLLIPNTGTRNNPRDTPIKIHQKVNDISYRELGVNIRNGVFCTTNRSLAEGYGVNLHVVIPTDKTTLYSNEKVPDFTEYYFYKSDNEKQFINFVVNILNKEYPDISKGIFKNEYYSEYEEYILQEYVKNFNIINTNTVEKHNTEIIVFGECYILPVNDVELILGKNFNK